jgi:hypothetical protein
MIVTPRGVSLSGQLTDWPGTDNGPADQAIHQSVAACERFGAFADTKFLAVSLGNATYKSLGAPVAAQAAQELTALNGTEGLIADAVRMAEQTRLRLLSTAPALDPAAPDAVEIRARLNAMPSEDRTHVVLAAARNNDVALLRAVVFDSPSFSLLSDQLRDFVAAAYLEHANPQMFAAWKTLLQKIEVAKECVSAARGYISGVAGMGPEAFRKQAADEAMRARLQQSSSDDSLMPGFTPATS